MSIVKFELSTSMVNHLPVSLVYLIRESADSKQVISNSNYFLPGWNENGNNINERKVRTDRRTLFNFIEELITQMRKLRKERAVETYITTRNSFRNFRKGQDIMLDEISSDVMMEYQAFLKSQNVSMNTISFYNRILRSIYNRAVEKGLTYHQCPFKHVYTGIDKTIKRAISLQAIKRIRDLDLSGRPSLELARAMFMFSFYTRGMSFIDMAFLKKSDLHNGVLVYKRRKTGQQMIIRWEKCMEEIVEKYGNAEGEYLLPIITKVKNERIQYRSKQRLINNKLKEISKMAGFQVNLTMYVTRHSWASIAQNEHVPLSVISKGMGHESEATTKIYLASLDNSIIDKANETILKKLR